MEYTHTYLTINHKVKAIVCFTNKINLIDLSDDLLNIILFDIFEINKKTNTDTHKCYIIHKNRAFINNYDFI